MYLFILLNIIICNTLYQQLNIMHRFDQGYPQMPLMSYFNLCRRGTHSLYNSSITVLSNLSCYGTTLSTNQRVC